MVYHMIRRKTTFLIITILFIILVSSSAIYYMYKKSYYININPETVYEIEVIKTYPYELIHIIEQEEIVTFIKKVNSIQYTHPHIDTGKGWAESVIIRMKNEDGVKSEYRYFILGEYIEIGSLRYRIVNSE